MAGSDDPTSRFDALESGLTARLGRPPETVELVKEFVRLDQTGLMGGTVRMLVEINAPVFLIYACMRTTQIVWPHNLAALPAVEQDEWKESVARYYSVHEREDVKPNDEELARDWQAAWERCERYMKRIAKARR